MSRLVPRKKATSKPLLLANQPRPHPTQQHTAAPKTLKKTPSINIMTKLHVGDRVTYQIGAHTAEGRIEVRSLPSPPLVTPLTAADLPPIFDHFLVRLQSVDTSNSDGETRYHVESESETARDWIAVAGPTRAPDRAISTFLQTFRLTRRPCPSPSSLQISCLAVLTSWLFVFLDLPVERCVFF